MSFVDKHKVAFCLSLAVVIALVASFPTSALAQYKQVNLDGDVAGTARYTDPNLKNGWGVAFLPGGPFWVADNTTGLSTLYDPFGHTLPLVVTVPKAPINPFFSPIGSPTGIVANTTEGFVVSANGHSGPALFLFDTEDGTISGWNPNVDATNAVVAIDNSASFAVYLGLTKAKLDGQVFIYAADFNNNKVDVFDSSFNPITLGPNAFVDPNLPAGMAVYGIQEIHGNLFVTYASTSITPLQGGVVDVFAADGTFIRRVSANGPGGPLESPWGTVIAPDNFGPASRMLLIGNVDDGRISVFNPRTGAFLGQLKDRKGNTIAIDGLWALVFGGGSVANGKSSHLFFTAGPNAYADGLFGVILPPGDEDANGQ